MNFADFAYEFMEADEAQPTSAPRQTAPAPAPRPPAKTSSPAKPTATKPTTTKPSGPAKTAGAKPTGTSTTKPSNTKSSTASAASSLSNFFTQIGKVTPYIQQGMDLAKTGVQIGKQFSGRPQAGQPPAGQPPAPQADPLASAPAQPGVPPGTVAGYDMPSPVGMPAPAPPGTPSGVAGMDQFTALLQALQQQQSGGQPVPAPPIPPAPPPPAYGQPQSDPLAVLRMILSNPQLQQALQQPTMGPAAPRTISLPMPARGQQHGSRQATIPLGAVMNAIYALAGQSMEQLNANTREDDPAVPEYLVGEDGEFLVDPASSEARAGLVARLFEISETARGRPAVRRQRRWIESEGDESELFALEAGFTR